MTAAPSMLPIALALLKVALVAGLGYGLTRRGLLHRGALTDFSSLVVQVAAPCLNFCNALSGSPASSIPSTLLLILSAPVVLGLGWIGGAALFALFRLQDGSRRAVIAASTFQNASYLPYAVAAAVLPPLAHLFPGTLAASSGIASAAVVDISLFGVLYLPLFWGLGLWWLQGGGATDAPRLTWRTLLPPPVIGIIAGYAIHLTPLRLLLEPAGALLHVPLLVAGDIGGLTVPLANLVLGGMLALALEGRHLRARDAAAAALAKLIWVPGVMFVVLALTRRLWVTSPAPALAGFVLFLECVSPPATNLAVMSRSRGPSGEAAEVVPGLLLVTYPLSLLTMPLWLTAFFRLLSP